MQRKYCKTVVFIDAAVTCVQGLSLTASELPIQGYSSRKTLTVYQEPSEVRDTIPEVCRKISETAAVSGRAVVGSAVTSCPAVTMKSSQKICSSSNMVPNRSVGSRNVKKSSRKNFPSGVPRAL
jgi:hypothetical protein